MLLLNVFYSEKHSTGVVRFTVILSQMNSPRKGSDRMFCRCQRQRSLASGVSLGFSNSEKPSWLRMS